MKLSVKALVLKGGKALLLRPKNLEGSIGGWDGPGGHVKPGESLLEALKREVLEETGLRIKEALPIKIITDPSTNTDYLICFCPIKTGKVVLSDEHTEYKWFAPENLPETIKKELSEGLREIKSFIESNFSFI